MKKQYVLKNKRRFICTILILTVILFTMIFVQTVSSYSESKYITVSVSKGDTLWDIASFYCNEMDVRKTVYDIKSLNNLSNDSIYVGQELIIPVKYYTNIQ